MGSNSDDSLERTIEHWQPYSKKRLTKEDAAEITRNMVGLFRLLQELDKKYPEVAKEMKGRASTRGRRADTAGPGGVSPQPGGRGPSGNAKEPRRSRGMLSVKAAAEYLSVSPKMVYRLVTERKLAHYKVGSRVLFKEQDLEKYLAGCRIGSVDEL